jgi:hypothetical protein
LTPIMPKLKLKRTAAEETEREHRKSRKRMRSEKHTSSQSSRSVHVEEVSDEEYGPQPHYHYAAGSSSKHKQDSYDSILAEVEEARFKEKLSMAMDDDNNYGSFDRLDAIESRFNDYAHVPDRYRLSSREKHHSRNVYDDDEYLSGSADTWGKLDPRHMDDEEYAEYIRMGMYRKTHAREHEEQERLKQARAEQKAQEKARRAELKLLEKEESERRKRKKAEKDSRKWHTAKESYDAQWKMIISSSRTGAAPEISYLDIPWPVIDRERALTEEDIRIFVLLPPGSEKLDDKSKKDRLRETMLRFHPDKFEGRIMARVRPKDQERVKEAMNLVVRTVQKLMGEQT